MNKKDYLFQLRQRLSSLPPGEMNDALDYYDGYLSDADNEAAAIAQLGTPAEVASQILAAYVTKKANEDAPAKKSPGIKTAWGILLVLLSPVALPLAISAIVLIIALIIVILAIGFSGGAAVLAGALALVMTPVVFFQDFVYSITMCGVGLAAVGIGFLLVQAAKTSWSKGINGLFRFVGGKISGKGGRK